VYISADPWRESDSTLHTPYQQHSTATVCCRAGRKQLGHFVLV
jgi:hypothetical protein